MYSVERYYFGARHGKNLCDALDGILKQAASRSVKVKQVTILSAEDLHAIACGSLSIVSGEGRELSADDKGVLAL